MTCPDKIREHMRNNSGPFCVNGLCNALEIPASTISAGLRDLIKSGEVAVCGEGQYRKKLFRLTGTAPATIVPPAFRPRITTSRVIRFCESPQDADPDRGIYYHRPQPAQAAMQPRAGYGLVWYD